MADSLLKVGHPELVPLLGEFIPGGKDRVPLQAADYLCWHVRRAEAQTMDARDAARWDAIANRKGFSLELPEKSLTKLAEVFREKEKGNVQ